MKSEKIPYCKKCPKIKYDGIWQFPIAKIRQEIQEKRIEHRTVGYRKTTCPDCEVVSVESRALC